MWFVLRRDVKHNFVELWNPMSAECYNFDSTVTNVKGVFGENRQLKAPNNRANDPQCTMKKLWCVVGQENIWANVQPDETPSLLDWNLDRESLWKPFLTKQTM